MSFEKLDPVNGWDLYRNSQTNRYYVGWYDRSARQTRRATLGTDKIYEAIQIIGRIDEAGVEDPRDYLHRKYHTTVRDLLEAHRSYVAGTNSAAIETINIDILLRSEIADCRLTGLNRARFERLKSTWLDQGLAIATVSRRLSTLRSALRQAQLHEWIPSNLKVDVPEYRKKAHIRSAPPKGRVCTPQELARLYVAANAPHFRLLLFFLFNTAARVGALLPLTAEQLDLSNQLISLNPEGRDQTKKYRSVLPMTRQLLAWSEVCAQFSKELITYHGAPLASSKTAMRAAVKTADLPSNTNTYSVRHSIGRYMRRAGVNTEEISVWLGHQAPPNNPETTLIYSPYEPDYLDAAKSAVEDFVDEIGKHSGVDFSKPPDEVRYYLIAERKPRT